jgi:hypothetical protein
MNSKGFGQKLSPQFKALSRRFPKGTEVNHENSVRIVDIPAEIRTSNLTSTNQECRRLSQLARLHGEWHLQNVRKFALADKILIDPQLLPILRLKFNEIWISECAPIDRVVNENYASFKILSRAIFILIFTKVSRFESTATNLWTPCSGYNSLILFAREDLVRSGPQETV